MNFPPKPEEMKPLLTMGINVFFTGERITMEERVACIGAGLFVYDVRQADEGGDPASIEISVFVNHYGTLICNKPIVFPEDHSYYPLSKKERKELLAIV